MFPEGNRSHYMRDFNSSVAKAVQRYTPHYKGGPLWARRYSSEFLPGKEDIEEYFFYTVLQPIKDGLVEKLSQYPGYNCFDDAVYGIKRAYKVVQWGAYHAAKRYNPTISIKSFIEIVYLQYTRLPGYEHLNQKEYAKLMYQKLERRRLEIVHERKKLGLGFTGTKALLSTLSGSLPKNTRTSDRFTHRPRVLSVCPYRYAECQAWYFEVYFQYKEASIKYRKGDLTTLFPEGTFRPSFPYIPLPL